MPYNRQAFPSDREIHEGYQRLLSRDKEGNGVGAEEKEPGFRKREAFIEFLPTDRLGWAIPVGANVVQRVDQDSGHS